MSVCAKEATNLRKATKPTCTKPSKTTLQETAKNTYFKINEPFQHLFHTDLAKALTKVREIGLTQSTTKAQKQKERRHDARTGTRQSFKQRDFQQKSLYFEYTEEAKIWSQKRKAPDPNSIDFDKEGLLQEVNSIKEGEKVRIKLMQIVIDYYYIVCNIFYCCK